jgi:heat shock protein HtpX
MSTGPLLVYNRIAANKRNTRLLLALFSLASLPVVLAIAAPVVPMILLSLGFFAVALTGGAVALVGGPALALNYLFLPIVVILGGIQVAGSLLSRFGSRFILRAAGATPLGPFDEPQLARTVENLCLAAGLPVPSLYIVESPVPNAFATGRDPHCASLVVTRGLLTVLDPRELEGVVAHELSHIGNHDIRLTTALAAFVSVAILPFSMCAAARAMMEGEIRFTSASVVLALTMLAGTGSLMLGFSEWSEGSWWWAPAYVLFISPVVALLTRTAVLWQREFLADADAVLLTRDPEGLALALVKIAAARGDRLRVGEGSVHLYFADPQPDGGSLIHGMFPTHPPVDQRIALLARMGSGIAPEALQRARETGIEHAQQRQEELEMAAGAGLPPSEPPRISLIPLYEHPDAWSRVLKYLPPGAVVTATGNAGRFIQVVTPDQVTGYVSGSAPVKLG